MASIPENHVGVPYADFLGSLSQKRSFRRYLEIGVNEGRLMSYVHADIAVGVDPNFMLTHNVAANKRKTILLNVTSDFFFDTPALVSQMEGYPDFAFLDGYHTFEYLLRDFMNTERISGRTSIIGMHDCLPLDEVMAERDFATWHHRTVGSKYQGSWTGDVWKVLSILQKYRPDLRLVLADCPPTGVVCVTGLNPSSTILFDKYLEIVEGFAKIPNTIEQISEMYSHYDLTSSAAIINGMDHSLFFNT